MQDWCQKLIAENAEKLKILHFAKFQNEILLLRG